MDHAYICVSVGYLWVYQCRFWITGPIKLFHIKVLSHVHLAHLYEAHIEMCNHIIKKRKKLYWQILSI